MQSCSHLWAAHLTQLCLFEENVFQKERNLVSLVGPVVSVKLKRLATSDTGSWFLVCALPHHKQALIGVEGSVGDALLSILQVYIPAESN